MSMLALVILLCVLLSTIISPHYFTTRHTESFLAHGYYVASSSSVQRNPVPHTDSYQHCTMESCFDFTRCRGPEGFKVYVYPLQAGSRRSVLFEEILRTIKTSPYITSNPEHACLFVPSFDVLDRDKLSEDFVKNIPSLNTLPYWNGGRNHLLFIQFSGTSPDYSERLDFATGQAILARASFNINFFRQGFDISVPLMHKKPLDLNRKASGHIDNRFLPVKRKYLLVFKGKRYLYGLGSRIRSSLYHLHNHEDIIMLTTCKHNQDWEKHTDERCDLDNTLYDRLDYEHNGHQLAWHVHRNTSDCHCHGAPVLGLSVVGLSCPVTYPGTVIAGMTLRILCTTLLFV